MRRLGFSPGLLWASAWLLCGCSSSHHQCANILWAAADRPTPNLLLGTSPALNEMAEEFASRSSWPSFEAGYQVEDTGFFSTFTYDDQSFYDRDAGGYSRQSVSERTGVIVR